MTIIYCAQSTALPQRAGRVLYAILWQIEAHHRKADVNGTPVLGGKPALLCQIELLTKIRHLFVCERSQCVIF